MPDFDWRAYFHTLTVELYILLLVFDLYLIVRKYRWDVLYFGGVIAMFGWIVYFICQPDNILIHTKAWIISAIIIGATILFSGWKQGYLASELDPDLEFEDSQ